MVGDPNNIRTRLSNLIKRPSLKIPTQAYSSGIKLIKKSELTGKNSSSVQSNWEQDMAQSKKYHGTKQTTSFKKQTLRFISKAAEESSYDSGDDASSSISAQSNKFEGAHERDATDN